MSANRPSVKVARPAGRYFKGKAPQEAPSDSSSDEEADQVSQNEEDVGGNLVSSISSVPARVNKSKPMTMGQVKGVTKEGQVTGGNNASSDEESSSEEESDDEPPRPQFRAPPKAGSSSMPTAAAASASEDGSSSEYETDSEEETPKVALRPTFVPKRARETLIARDANTLSAEAAAAKLEEEERQRKLDSHNMVAESLRKELAEKEAVALTTDVDDTDGLSPESEFQEWRLRELTRLKRDKEASLAFEKEREEVERRRAMPEQERMKEDLKRAEESRREKENSKGTGGFLQKFYHKGAFHQDEEILKNRDYQAPTESAVDFSMLPKVMQKRNFGKMSQTKYTHLADQDTTKQAGGFGFNARSAGGGGEGCFNCGGPHLKKDCPQLQNFQPSSSAHATSTTGANNASGPSRSWGASTVSRDYRDRDRDQDRDGSHPRRDGHRDDRDKERSWRQSSNREQDVPYRSRRPDDDYRRNYRRSQSRSRSPRRDRERSRHSRDIEREGRREDPYPKNGDGRRRDRSNDRLERERTDEDSKRRRRD